MIQIFDQVNGRPVPSVHCHMVKAFRDIIDFYPEDYLQVLYFIQSMVCKDPTVNIYMNQEESRREEIVIADIGPLKFSLECPIVIAGMEKCKKLYETPVDRSYTAAKVMLDKIAVDMIDKDLTYGQKDGNATIMKGFMKELPILWKAYKELTAELIQEQSIARGNVKRAYDQMPGYKNLKDEDND